MHPRQIAKASGAKRYVGKPCKRCNETLRYVSSGGCVACYKAAGRTDSHRAVTRKWYAAHSDEHKELRDAWRSDNIIYVRQYNDEYRREHLGLYCAHTVAYKLRKEKAMPVWADVEAIKKIYENCPAGHQVDHVIPLRGKLVSGLHVEGNLQYLPGSANNKKGNSYVVS